MNKAEKQNGYTKLVKNTAIFAIGSFGSKVLSFLIVPLYTYVLSTEEYGRIDLFTTAISLVLPFVTLLIQEALLRFLMGKEVSETVAINNCFAIFLIGSTVSVLLSPIFSALFKLGEYLWLFIVILVLNAFTQIFSQYFRAVGRNIAFTINGIIVTVTLLSSNVLFLVGLKLGMRGYYYAMLLSQIASTCHIVISGRILTELSPRAIDAHKLKEMLKFSIPLIPNTLMWWIMSAGDKYIINYYLGDSANGIYSLSLKVPTVISLIYTIFYQAWQMSAIEAQNEENKKSFYSNVFMVTNALLSMLIVIVISVVKPVYVFAMSQKFESAWMYVPLLSIATFFSCCGSFFGVVYTVSKKSYMAFFTTAVGAIVNLTFNFLLVKRLGLYGIAIGTTIGYVAVTLMRVKDAKREIGMSFDVIRTLLMASIIICQAILTTVFNGYEIYAFGLIAFTAVILLYRHETKDILRIFADKLRKKQM